MTLQVTPIEKTLAAIRDAQFQKEVERVSAAHAKLPELLKAIDKAAANGDTCIGWKISDISNGTKQELENAGYRFSVYDYNTYLIWFDTGYGIKSPAKRSFFQYLTDTDTGAFSGWGGGFTLGFCAMSALIIFFSVLPSILRYIGVI